MAVFEIDLPLLSRQLQGLETRMRWVRKRRPVEDTILGAFKGAPADALELIWPAKACGVATAAALRGVLAAVEEQQPRLARIIERHLSRLSGLHAAPGDGFELHQERYWRDQTELLYRQLPTRAERKLALSALEILANLRAALRLLRSPESDKAKSTLAVAWSLRELDTLAVWSEKKLRPGRNLLSEEDAIAVEEVFNALQSEFVHLRRALVDLALGVLPFWRVSHFYPLEAERQAAWERCESLQPLLQVATSGDIHSLLNAIANCHDRNGRPQLARQIEDASGAIFVLARRADEANGTPDDGYFALMGQIIGKLEIEDVFHQRLLDQVGLTLTLHDWAPERYGEALRPA
ncbi:MAG: hypothetical protein ACKVPX_08960 [Myxococcaceae bacterium]